MDPVVSVQNKKLLRKHKGACKSSWSQLGNLKSFTLTIPWNFAKLVKIFPGIIVRQHHTDQNQIVNSTPHTSHFLVESQHFYCHIDIGSRSRCVAHFISSHPCAHVLCCLILSDLQLFAFHLLSHLSFHSLYHLHLPCGRQEPCALLLMRSQALWPRTILSHKWNC